MSVNYPYIYNTGTNINVLDTYNQTPLNGLSPSDVFVPNDLIQTSGFGENFIVLTTVTDQAAGGRLVVDIENIVPNDAFTIAANGDNITNTINWFLLVNNNVSNYSGTTVFLPWVDIIDTAQSYGKITMGDGGQAFLTSKYLTNSTSAEAISRIFLTVDTLSPSSNPSAYEITQYDPLTGTVKITAEFGFDRSTLNYFIITKNNNPYIATAEAGSYISLIESGANITCGIAQLNSGQVTINTTNALVNSVILASTYATISTFPGTLFVPNDEIVPAISFNIHSTSNASNSVVTWLIISPASNNP